MSRPLSEKQRRFTEEYLVDANATQAAIRAGYARANADKQGSRLVGNSRVAAEIKRLQDLRTERVELTADMVIRGLIDNWRRASEAEPVTDKDGNVVGIVYQGNVVNKALELLGKHKGMFTDRVEHAGSVPVTIIYENVSSGEAKKA